MKLYPLNLLCSVFKVSCAGFYYFIKTESYRQKKLTRELALAIKIESVFNGSKKTYGSPRIFAILKAINAVSTKNKVAACMKKFGLRSRLKKKYKNTTDSNHNQAIAPNHLMQNFKVYNKNQIWVSDITYIWTEEGFLYLACILDLWSRKIVGWSFGERLTTDLILKAFYMAISGQNPLLKVIFHSDRGSQYASKEFRAALQRHGFIQSMSRKGNCWDNAVMESFFHTLKCEFVYFEKFQNRNEAKTYIFHWIESFYNRQRIHSSIGYRTPQQMEVLTMI